MTVPDSQKIELFKFQIDYIHAPSGWSGMKRVRKKSKRLLSLLSSLRPQTFVGSLYYCHSQTVYPRLGKVAASLIGLALTGTQGLHWEENVIKHLKNSSQQYVMLQFMSRQIEKRFFEEYGNAFHTSVGLTMTKVSEDGMDSVISLPSKKSSPVEPSDIDFDGNILHCKVFQTDEMKR